MITIRPVLIVALIALSSSAQAEWFELGRTSAFRVYIENKSILRRGDLAQVMQLIDFTNAQWVDTHTVIGSVRQLNEFDCAQGRYRTLGAVAFSEQMTEGKMVGEEKTPEAQWMAVEPESAADQVRKLVCGKK